MRRLICWLFGHRQHAGWWGDGLYGTVQIGPIDGTGRTHFSVYKACDRCGQVYTLARFHGSQRLIAAMSKETE